MRTTNIDTLSIYYTSQTQFAHHRMGLVIPADSCLTNQNTMLMIFIAIQMKLAMRFSNG